MVREVQGLFIERLTAWKHHMAPSGWNRQRRWNQRGWARLILYTLKHNAKGRRQRKYAVRRIGVVLMRIYHDEDAWMALIERKEAHHARKHEARKRIGGICECGIPSALVGLGASMRSAPELILACNTCSCILSQQGTSGDRSGTSDDSMLGPLGAKVSDWRQEACLDLTL